MKRFGSIVGYLVISLLLSIPLVAVLAVGTAAMGVTFPAFNLFDFVSRLLPGQIIIPTIETMVKIIRALDLGPTDTSAKTAERLMAILLFTGAATVVSLIYFAVVRRPNRGNAARRASLISSLILGVVALVAAILLGSRDTAATAPALLSAGWLAIVFLLWGLAHGVTQDRLDRTLAAPAIPSAGPDAQVTEQALSRRQFLVQLGSTSAMITFVGVGLDVLLTARSGSTHLPEPSAVASGADEMDSTGLLMPAPGTRPEYTPLAQHYRIDINAGSGPFVDGSTYKLDIGGLVDSPTQLTLDDLRTKFASMDQIITMSCISNPVAGDLISTTRWTGLSMQDLVKLVKPKAEAAYLRISSADDFVEVVGLDVIQKDPRVMLAYAWDGQPLTQEHGFPLRIHVPDHYGMKQPKWITKMEFITDWEPGYWVKRGWSREATVRATSVIDTIASDNPITRDGAKLIPIGGIAWAGARGIAKVEVKIDDGDWAPAQLRKPQSDKAWVIWRYDWPFAAGKHTFAVRCTETDGTAQVDKTADVFPAGATGVHSVTYTL